MKIKRLTQKEIKYRLHHYNSNLNRSRHEDLKKSKKKSKNKRVPVIRFNAFDLIV